MHRLDAFYLKDLSIQGFWYLRAVPKTKPHDTEGYLHSEKPLFYSVAYVNHLSITMTKFLRKTTEGKIFIWGQSFIRFMVSWPCCLHACGIMGVCGGGDCLFHGDLEAKENKGLYSLYPFQGYTPNKLVSFH